jgi:chromosome segregation ATPase
MRVIFVFGSLLFFYDFEFNSLLCQAAAFAEHIASGALNSKFVAERRRLKGRIERLRTHHTEAVRDKSAAENKSLNLMEKMSAAEAKKEDLGRRLAAETEDADRARAEAQAARAEANLALQRAAEAESSHRSLHGYLDKAEASTRTGVDRAHALLVDAYQ